jgi:alpha-glucosidase
MLALPGSAYLYQGEELGLPEAIDIPDDKRQDPTFFRTQGERYGRDGCRVPLPWEADVPAFGFNQTGHSWLPQPQGFQELARDQQKGQPGSTLEMYRTLLNLRLEHGLGRGGVRWLEGYPSGVVALINKDVAIIANVSAEPVSLPDGEIVACSGNLVDGQLPADNTAWVKLRT